VVQIFLIDPEREEQDDNGLEEDDGLCEPWDALPDRNIVFFETRNPTRSREMQADPQADLERDPSYGQPVSSERDDQIRASTRVYTRGILVRCRRPVQTARSA